MLSTRMMEDLPTPPRYWWLKRAVVALALVALALLGLRLLAGRHAARLLASAEAAIRERGGPVVPADLDAPPLRDSENAAVYLRRAAAGIILTPAQSAAEDNLGTPKFSPADRAALRAAVMANAPPLADARVARQVPRAVWTARPRRPLFNVALPDLSPQRRLYDLLRDAAVVDMAAGDSAAALGRVADALRVGEAQMQADFLVNQLVGIGITEGAADMLRRALPDLQIEPAASPPARPASRRQVRDLIATLLDDRPITEGMARGWAGERVLMLDAFDDVASKNWLFAPVLRGEAALAAAQYDPPQRESAHPTGAALARLAPLNRPAPGSFGFLSDFLLNFERPVRSAARTIGSCRLAAVALACKLYQADHGGALPPTLAALVPDYLPAVPADPFRPGGGPLGYAPDFVETPGAAVASPRVYSVGEDEQDDGGAGDVEHSWVAHSQQDVPFALGPVPPVRGGRRR